MCGIYNRYNLPVFYLHCSILFILVLQKSSYKIELGEFKRNQKYFPQEVLKAPQKIHSSLRAL